MNAHEDLFAEPVHLVPGASACDRPPGKLVAAAIRSGDYLVTVPRTVLERCRDLAERVLRFSGESPDRDLIQLQHDLAELLPPPASPDPERSTETK